MTKILVDLAICFWTICFVGATAALGGNILQLGTPVLDRPTITALGVKLPITGDDNTNASVTVRFRKQGASVWSSGLPLFRVRPETVTGYTVAPQFAGSIFDLEPATSYQIELRATDPDGNVDQTFTLSGTTRSVPRDPVNPRLILVNDSASLQSAVNNAQPGDIIQLADGVYRPGSLYVNRAGTALNPIVIRGSSEDNTVLDGDNCTGCNVVEIYGAGYVHIERMTIQNAVRAIRFQTTGAEENVVRRVHTKNTTLGIGGRDNQLDFYICDNTVEGRLLWPNVYWDDNGTHANDDGINVKGFGHVVCHNRISGFGDAMKTSQDGARSNDFYGNDILWTYDNGVELDAAEGNVRLLRNRFTNTFSTISVQPIHGGPAYIIRNVVVNIASEQMKFHALGVTPPEETSGVLVYHNTFVSPVLDLGDYTSNVAHNFVMNNNLFVGPRNLPGRAVDWEAPTDLGYFDYNGYFPNGQMSFNILAAGGYQNYPNFAALQAGGYYEAHGRALNESIFANGLVAPASYTVLLQPADAALAAGSNAIDAGVVLPNVNDGFSGSAPDLGALERGRREPIYGVRPEGVDESNEPGIRANAPFDFDGDGKSDISVFRPTNGTWYGLNSASNNSFFARQFGISTDKIVPADYDGDGKTDLAVFRPATGVWYRLNSSDNSFAAFQFGQMGDVPVAADYDADGKADLAVFRPSSGVWYVQGSSRGFFSAQFGQAGDLPQIGDFDGDGKNDLAVYRPSNRIWYRLNSSNNQFIGTQFGAPGDVPDAMDYDADGKTDLAVFRPATGVWYLQQSTAGFAAVQFGVNGDRPAAADFDGDGKADIAVFRLSSGTWYVNRSSQGVLSVQFGQAGDAPIESAFVP